MGRQILLIALILAALVFALIFVTSMSDAIADKYAYLSSGHLQIHNQTTIDDIPYPFERVSKAPALLYSKTHTELILLKGVDPSYFEGVRSKELTMIESSLQETTLMEVMISSTLAQSLDVTAGMHLGLMISSEERLRPTLVFIRSIYESGYTELDQNLVFTSNEQLLSLAHLPLSYELLVPIQEIQSAYEALQAQGYDVTTWAQEAPAIEQNLQTSKEATFIVLIFIAVLLGYMISELARQIVADDQRQIIILRLLGSSKRIITTSYFLTLMTATFLATILGVGGGVALSYALTYLLQFLAVSSTSPLSFYLLRFSITIPTLRLMILSLIVLASSALSLLITLLITLRDQNVPTLTFD